MANLITIDTNSATAPGCYLVCKVSGKPGQYDWSTTIESDTVLIQTDRDFPGLAESFGWLPPDGMTIESDLIQSAIIYMDNLINLEFGSESNRFQSDPGYFHG